MDDEAIIELYWHRAKQALSETRQKYGTYCSSIAMQILHSREDAEECVNDIDRELWQRDHPARPSPQLAAFHREHHEAPLSLNRPDYTHAQKRHGDIVAAIESYRPGGRV